MANLKSIKTKIRATGKTRQVTKAMEAVSAAKMRKSQATALAARAYARAAVSILARLSGSKELLRHPLAQQDVTLLKNSSKVSPCLYVVITSDKGLAGALNSAVLRAVQQDIDASEGKASVIAIGRKANDYFSRRGYKVEAFYENKEEKVSSELMNQVVHNAAKGFISGHYGAVKVAYQSFRSTFEQKPALRTVFPLSLGELSAVVNEIVPKTGKYAAMDASTEPSRNYAIEPSEEEVLVALLPKLASIFLYHALLETQASEHSARMVAMKSASDKASELTHMLTVRFNKARQAAITREVSEITGGMEALAA